MSMENDFFKMFDIAKNNVSHLCLDVGYSRMTDWVVAIFDKTGRQKSGWGDPIAHFQSSDRKYAFSQAYLWLCDWLKENHGGY